MKYGADAWRLASGMRINAISDPSATRAAALLLVDTGSVHEPAEWPGLAHLLEHLLFRGSANVAAGDGLMSWVQSVGGKVNASTQAVQTAFFFEASAEHLAGGLDRLSDMLAAPGLADRDIAQEIEVIDAEYRLLRDDPETCCQAAERQMFKGIAALRRFHIGSRETFGTDIPRLQRALRQFHQRRFRPAGMTLWLHGPQPLSQLHALAECFGAPFAPADAPANDASGTLSPAEELTLSLPVAPQLRLVFSLEPEGDRGWLRRLERLVRDDAPGGLMAHLRAHAECDGVRLAHALCSENSMLVSFIFTLNTGSPTDIANIESALLAWLQHLRRLSPLQREHYGQLANRDFARLTLLDQLRARAFGLPPVEQHDSWDRHITALLAAPRRRLAVLPESVGERCYAEGLPLTLSPFVSAPPTRTAGVFQFYPRPEALPAPPLPRERARLLHLADAGSEPVLLLRPAPFTRFTECQAARLHAGLRAGAAEIAHYGGHLGLVCHQDRWLLELSGRESVLSYGLSLINPALNVQTPALLSEASRSLSRSRKQQQSDIAIRRLLAQLPEALVSPGNTPPHWHATLVGGDKRLKTRLAHLLHDFPFAIEDDAQAPPAPPIPPVTLGESGAENALLQFYPLAGHDAQGRWALRVLATLYAPRYFRRLRVERSVGYVVQCAFHRSRGIEGLLFALQSPNYDPAQLRQLNDEFLLHMSRELPSFDLAERELAHSTVSQHLRCLSADPLLRAREVALENRDGLETVSPLAIADLLYWHRLLFAAPAG